MHEKGTSNLIIERVKAWSFGFSSSLSSSPSLSLCFHFKTELEPLKLFEHHKNLQTNPPFSPSLSLLFGRFFSWKKTHKHKSDASSAFSVPPWCLGRIFSNCDLSHYFFFLFWYLQIFASGQCKLEKLQKRRKKAEKKKKKNYKRRKRKEKWRKRERLLCEQMAWKLRATKSSVLFMCIRIKRGEKRGREKQKICAWPCHFLP